MASLNGYLQQVQRLLNDVTQARFNLEDLRSFINTARGQVAGESACIRRYGTVTLIAAGNEIGFSSIVPVAGTIGGILNVRQVQYLLGASDFVFVTPRNWEWYALYGRTTVASEPGPPQYWAQYGQGATGSFNVYPVADAEYTLYCDCTCYPVDLATEATAELIPYLWTDAVPYFAAYLAYLTAQQDEIAEKMLGRYQIFMNRAREAANPPVNTYLYQQSKDPTKIAKLGLKEAIEK